MMVPPEALVLVCILPKPSDFEIARMLGWYRIPLRNAPKVISVDALAFYLPSSFGKAGGCLNYTALVRGHELTTRRELLHNEPNHPHANEEYFKLQIGDLVRLPKPILPGKWKRFSFFYTTGEYLQKAETLTDLIVRNEERLLLWKTLRERAKKNQEYKVEIPELPLSNDMLLALLGLANVPLP